MKEKLKLLKGSIYFVLAARLFFMMLLFSVCRILFYLFNTSIYPDMTFRHFICLMGGGLKFDLTAVLYTNSLYIIFQLLPFRFRYKPILQKIFAYIFYVTNGLTLMANCIDFIYFRFTLRRTTWSVFQEFSNDKGNVTLAGRFFIDYWYVVLAWIALVVLMVLLYRCIKLKQPIIKNRVIFYITHTVLMVLFTLLSISGMRGGFLHSTRPITISNAAQYTNNPAETGIVLNTPFSIYRTLQRQNYPRLHYFKTQEELNAVYTPVHLPKADSLAFKPKNVVIIILESFAKEHFGALNKNSGIASFVGYTPFLDSLISKSLVFEYSYANGRKSIDAMPSVLTSVPSFVDPYVLSIYSNNRIKGLPALLKEKGYNSSFFHGAPNGSMGFQSFAKMAGFDNYYGKKEYNNDADFDGWWGIWDEPFFQFFANTLNQKQEPFMASIFSVSSHHPFQVPKEYEGKFPKGTLKIHQCVGYTDNALRLFFESASKMPWFKNTIFVITADHTTESSYDEYRTVVGNFKVPVIFYDPSNDSIKGVVRKEVIQQIDIMPSVLGYLHYDKPYFAFGFDAFSKQTENQNFAINYLNGSYQIYESNYVLETNEKGIHALYDYIADPLLKKDLKTEESEKATRLDLKYKAFLQQYNNKLIDNKMVAE